MNYGILLYAFLHDIIVGQNNWSYIPFWKRIKRFDVSDPRKFRRLNGSILITWEYNYVFKWKKIKGNWYKMVDYCGEVA